MVIYCEFNQCYFLSPLPPETRAGGELEPLQPHLKDNPSGGGVEVAEGALSLSPATSDEDDSLSSRNRSKVIKHKIEVITIT